MILISCQPHKLNKFILINKIFKLKYQILNIEICALRFFFLFPKWRRKLLASAHPLIRPRRPWLVTAHSPQTKYDYFGFKFIKFEDSSDLLKKNTMNFIGIPVFLQRTQKSQDAGDKNSKILVFFLGNVGVFLFLLQKSMPVRT